MARSKNAKSSPAAVEPTNAPPSNAISIERRRLLEAIIPDPDHAGSPAVTALLYVADELEAIAALERDECTDDNLVADMLFRLRLRTRAIADLLSKDPSLNVKGAA